MMNQLTAILLLPFLLSSTQAATNTADGRATVLLTAPLESSTYYNPTNPDQPNRYNDFVNFHASFAKILIAAGVNVVISCDAATAANLTAKAVPADVLWQSEIQDIWMRDPTRVNPNKQAGFAFLPAYIALASDANAIQRSFDDAVAGAGLTFDPRSDLILDGGNVVDNLNDKAVVGARFMAENELQDIEDTQRILKAELGYQHVSIVPEIDGDTTGHSDGMVSFIDSDTIAYSNFDDQTVDVDGELARESMVQALQVDFGNQVQLVPVPYKYPTGPSYRSFTSGCGTHINALFTGDKLFVPTFGEDPENVATGLTTEDDKAVLDIIRGNTNAQVYEVPVPKRVCETGGNVRCLSWLVVGENANKLVQHVAANSG